MIPPPYPGALRSTTARGAMIAALALALPVAGLAQESAPEPPAVPYTAEVTAADSDALAALGNAVAQTVTLRERAPTDAFGLIGRVRADLPRLQDALRAEGYWGGSVAATIAGRSPDDPALPALLQSATDPVPVVLTLTPGPLYRIGRVTVTADPPADAPAVQAAAAESGLAEGDPARTAAVSGAEGAMTEALRRSGHPTPSIDGREIWVDHDRRTMDIAWRIAPGPVATFARPSVTGEVRTNAGLLERTAARQIEGREYSPATLERGRRALVALGVFDSVRAEPATELAPGNRLPVTFHVSERPLRAIGGTISWETNYGLGISAFWEHRNLFGGAERLRLEAEATRLTETDAPDATYRAFATLTVPEILGYDARLIARVGAVREFLDAYDREAVVASALAEHSLSPRLAVQAGPTFETGRIGRDGVLDPYSLLGVVGGVRWDGTTSLLNPTSGQRASITATPYWSMQDGATFTRLLATGSTYFDVSGDGGSVLALRAAVGSVVGASFDQIILDKRFYAGGGGSVRGYTYQSIGPRDAQNRPLGGASLLEFSAEWRQRISGPWGAVAFVDGGSVSEDMMPGSGTMRIGVGGGIRYNTAIGPIRVDIGMPLNPQTGDAAYALYVGIGQAF
ncbi:autotransporter assembly complex protein TamA [Neoroseomonas oryzicola]|uniref:BamA/TamA family outer membrane protein n=1 Tax=Neoroseomonas oryzicola TaxID=535904 RepID=A0A9X9WCR7_9PROT|nr:BamA/TamA family outer membrane protein [Neoroseomonas oryzicola]MBR0658127.1 BamA/TamA family outer membrane protein [Neoroseomonas oryzicola]NKE15344.1 BamA/TamA family outer membrane protein [Neoroseomonas oryzicola]